MGTPDVSCPKCHATMRTYERSGIHVDQCTECRGIFLDRGELDRLLDAEAQAYGAATASAAPAQAQYRSDYPSGRDDRGHGRKRKSFLGELFD